LDSAWLPPNVAGAGRTVSVVERGRSEVGDEALVLTVEEAAQLLGISRGLGYELVRQGVIPSLRLGRQLVVPRKRLVALVEDLDGRGQRAG